MVPGLAPGSKGASAYVSRLERWIKDLGYGEVPGALLGRADQVPADHPFATEVGAMFDVAVGVGASAVLCIDRVPTVCLVDAAHLNGERGPGGATPSVL